jgi:hypothetical protein
MRDTRSRDVLMIVAGSILAISTLLVGVILPARLSGGHESMAMVLAEWALAGVIVGAVWRVIHRRFFSAWEEGERYGFGVGIGGGLFEIMSLARDYAFGLPAETHWYLLFWCLGFLVGGGVRIKLSVRRIARKCEEDRRSRIQITLIFQIP